MTLDEIAAAWAAAHAETSSLDGFYRELEAKTGLPEGQVASLFAEWNKLPHGEVLEISRNHASDVPSLQAYLSEVAFS